jgi:hypothetical protein
LTHQDRDEKIGDNSVGNLPGVRLVSCRETDEYGYVGREGDTEKPSVNGEEQIVDISDGLGVFLLGVFLIEITLLVEACLFVGGVWSRVARRSRSRDSFLRFHDSREIDGFGFLSGWLWGGSGFTTARKREVNIEESKESRKNSTHLGSGPSSLDILDT